jgi:plasmid maintenance system antidote protein VapI
VPTWPGLLRPASPRRNFIQAADALGVSRKHVSAILNGRAPDTPDMAASKSAQREI